MIRNHTRTHACSNTPRPSVPSQPDPQRAISSSYAGSIAYADQFLPIGKPLVPSEPDFAYVCEATVTDVRPGRGGAPPSHVLVVRLGSETLLSIRIYGALP